MKRREQEEARERRIWEKERNKRARRSRSYSRSSGTDEEDDRMLKKGNGPFLLLASSDLL